MTAPATPRGLLFGTAAETYERFRLGYPDEVVHRTLGHLGRPVRSALEVGAGTGKATRAFASRGVAVVALEPDPDMCAVLRRETAGMPVTTVLSTFEAYDGPAVDVLYAAASWHWTDPATRWSHAAALLEPGGVLSIFGSRLRLADPELEAAVDAAVGEVDEVDVTGWRTRDLDDCGFFEDVQESTVSREVVVGRKEYVGHLSTLSAYLRLPVEDRRDVVRTVTDLLPHQVALDADVGMHLARRR
jgi:SAM-dependent methyltransferase